VGVVSLPTELELDGRVRAELRRGTRHADGNEVRMDDNDKKTVSTQCVDRTGSC
jgi:hypothetical protein